MSCDVRIVEIESARGVGVDVRVCDVRMRGDGTGVEIEGKLEKHSCEVERFIEGIDEGVQKHSDEVQHDNGNEYGVEMLVAGSSLTSSIA